MADLLTPRPATRRRLRELLAADEPVIAPGAYDALSARLVEAAGFAVVYMTGFGTTASLIGRPDVGLLTQTEMTDNAGRMAGAVGVPVVADADTGYGNPINVVRTVAEYERAGVAGIHLEDQVSPKRCGHLSGKEVVPAADMVAKLRAAAAARTDPDFVIIARTDAIATDGVPAAVERAHAYAEAGADALFVEAPRTEDEIEEVAAALAGTPLVFNLVPGGRTPPMPVPRLGELGFRLILYPVTTLLAATAAMRGVLGVLRAEGEPPEDDDDVSFDEFVEFIGLGEISELERRFGS
ncbi:MAG TPA: isocitrate lyase/PEP mutase family protein [Solirubrobacteraceae bacterium]